MITNDYEPEPREGILGILTEDLGDEPNERLWLRQVWARAWAAEIDITRARPLVLHGDEQERDETEGDEGEAG